MESLYTNIGQKDAIDAAEWVLHTYSNTKQEQIRFILEGLLMAMSKNYFWHQGEFFNQVKGIEMGARYAPS